MIISALIIVSKRKILARFARLENGHFGDTSDLIHALNIASKAKGMTEIAKQAGVSRASLYNGHVRPPDTTKHERTWTADCELFHINAHGLRPTTNHESFDMAMLINSFQIKSLSDDGNPRFETISKIVNALGSKIAIA